MIQREKVLEQMADFLKLPIEKFEDAAVLTDLVTQSFVLVELVIDLQEEFGVRFGQEQLKGVRTVGELVTLIVSSD